MATLDIETLMSQIETFLKANINTSITAMNTEKGDSLLGSISNSAYFFQTMNDEVANYDPYLFYGVENIESEGIGPGTSQTVTINVIVCVTDQGQDFYVAKKLFRYGRILKELFETSWDKINYGVKFKVNSLVPISFQLVNSSNWHRAIGVTLEAVLF